MDNVNNKSFNELSKRFSELEQHSINLELALQQNPKAQLQDKDIAISELKKLIEKMKGKSVETKFEKPSVIRQANAFKSQRQSVLGVIPTISVSRPQLKRINWKIETKQPIVVPISIREPKRIVNQSVATPLKRTVASESTNQKPRSKIRKQYEHISKTCKWWYSKITPPGYKWKPKTRKVNVTPNFSMPLGNKSRTISNTPSSSNSFAARRDNYIHHRLWVLKAHDGKSQASNSRKYHYQKSLLRQWAESQFFSVGQFCDADLEVAFQKSTCYVRDLKGNDLLTATSSQAWLWHRRLSHLNFDSINLLSNNDIVIGLPKYTWTHFLRSKDETPEVLIDFLRLVQRGIHAQVRTVRTDKGTEFLNKTLHAYFAQEGIEHQTSTARTLEQNGVVKRRNRTLVEAARTMLSASKVPLFFWAEAISTTCFTQNRSLVIPRHKKTPYHIIYGRKPFVKFFHIFGSLRYIVRDGENLDKIKEKGDACIFVGHFTMSRGYRVYNKRTRVIVETIHVNFDELPQMALNHVSYDPASQCPITKQEQGSLSLGPQSQENVPQAAETVTTSNELDFLFSPMFDELLNGTTQVVSKSSAITTADAPNQRQNHNTTSSTSTTVAADIPPLNIQTTPETTNQAPTVTAIENINQAETDKENAQVKEDQFIYIFSTPVQERGETSSRYVDSSNMHTFYQRHPSKHRWTKDHPLEQVIGNHSQSIRTRRQLETDGEMCMFALTVSRTEPKNIKEAMADSAWIEAMREELHQFDR
ncbi:putative ribonuclease H-like domain-containing protein [Tanacetum coccineum]